MLDSSALLTLLPEISLMLLGMLILGCQAFAKGTPPLQRLAAFGLALIISLILFLPTDSSTVSIGPMIVTSSGRAWKILFVAAALLTVLLARSYFEAGGNARGTLEKPGPFLALLIFSTMGACLIVSAGEWLTFFLALELATLPLYALAGMQSGELKSAEASAKYIILGGLSTSLVLFGISFLYAAAGKLDFPALAAAAQADPSSSLLWLGALFLFAGIGFKLSIAPFHMWAPDVYEGAPTPMMAYLSVGSKAAAAAALAVVFLGPLNPLRPALAPFFGGAAVLSMVAGNLGALRQKNLRRFIAYSSIAQAGYLLFAFLGSPEAAGVSLLYNLVAYGATSYCFYFVVGIVGKSGEENFNSLRGLSRKNPAVALALLLAMFSLAGVPPLGGFFGKFLLFSAAAGEGHYVFVLLGVANAVVSFYYYMLIVKEAYISSEEFRYPPFDFSKPQSLTLATLGLVVIALGIFPNLGRYLQTLF